jgi:DNA-directed RNA polymerase subunit RPC12/RpoP
MQKTVKIDMTWARNVPKDTPPRKEIYVRQEDIHCPNCGQSKNVWTRKEEFPDYYEGPEYICTQCATMFTVPSLVHIDDSDKVYKQVLDQLKDSQ